MKAAAAGHGIQFSTDLLPERDRLPYLRETFGRSICGVDLQPFQDCPLEWTASLHAFEDLLVVSQRTAGMLEQRTHRCSPIARTIFCSRSIDQVCVSRLKWAVSAGSTSARRR